MNREKTIKRLLNLAIQVGIRSEKCNYYIFLYSLPRPISIFILFAGIIQLTSIYLKFNSTYQTLIAIVLCLLSLTGVLLDLVSDKKERYIKTQREAENIMSELQTFYNRLYNSNSKTNFTQYNTDIEVREKLISDNELTLSIFSDSSAEKRFMKKRKSIWLRNAIDENA
jgi:hypothetical protein